ncbi:LuxR C-terminal-related transcriptional regulator [Streptomyces sp. NPDC058653]|uniref:helix-turn-helix transcriptional regulator n=1 Tax=Streptomyces sp. NPDC058653 TaxID=3346576 RepID=UPI003650F84A
MWGKEESVSTLARRRHGGETPAEESSLLEPFGISHETEQLYFLLVKHPGMCVREVAMRLDWHESVVEEQIGALAELSLLWPSHGESGGLYPVEPEIGLDMLIAREHAALAARTQVLQECKVAARVLAAEFTSRPGVAPLDVEQVDGTGKIHDRLVRLAREAKSGIMVFTPGGPLIPEATVADRGIGEEILSRGIRIQSVQLDSVRNNRARMSQMQRLLDKGIEIRTVPVLSLRGLIVDGEKALLSEVVEDSSENVAVVLSGSSVVASIAPVFEQVWLSAAPFSLQDQGRERELTNTEGALLHLLEEGYTDAQAARRLAVSTRTVGRIVADLMTQLGASSRFQAGVLARRRGWLGP